MLENQLEPNVLFFTTAPQHPHDKLHFGSVITFGFVLLQMWFVPGTNLGETREGHPLPCEE